MLWTDIAFALLIALILAAVFVPLLGWRRPGDTIGDELEEDAAGWGAAFLFFFLIVFLFTVAAGLWLEPVGPVAWGVPWLGFLFIGILVALLLAAAAPPPRRGPRPMEGTEEQLDIEEAAGLGLFFWLLIFVLVITLAAAVAVV